MIFEFSHGRGLDDYLSTKRSFESIMLDVRALGPRAVDPLIELLGSHDGYNRWGAARVLGLLKERAAIPELIKLLDADSRGDGDLDRVDAARALGRIGDKVARGAVTVHLEDRNAKVRAACVESLGSLAEGGEVEKICDMLTSDPDPAVRVACANLLSELRNPKSVDALRRAMKDPSVAQAAAMGLANLGYADGIDLLAQSLEDLKGAPFGTAARTRIIVSLSELDDIKAKALLTRLADTDADPSIRLAASYALGREKGTSRISR